MALTPADGKASGRDTRILLGHHIDDLLLQLRGLVLVRDLLVERGASSDEVTEHTDALERVRRQLADTIRGGGGEVLEAA
jgi:hypothetical protein